jgi:hypothetical protein
MKADLGSKIKAFDGLLTEEEGLSTPAMKADLEARGFEVETYLNRVSRRISEARGAALPRPVPVASPEPLPARAL